AAAAAFAGRDAQALRNDPNLTDMGRWSDGWPVKRLGVADAPRAEAPAPAKVDPEPDKTPAPRKRP
ncbi:MAG TPA: alpha/beta hydrolase, partial [Beijerinckiaceae bacterium]|nr:alpha/beta hydrolase [Beijerinckiaceae bacterium]